MTSIGRSTFLLVFSGVCAIQQPSTTQPGEAAREQTEDSASAAVLAILEKHCVSCHSGARPPRGANFETLSGVLAARADRPALVVPGDPDRSEIIRRITGISEPRMPLDGPPWLTDAQVDVIRSWIISLAPSAHPSPATEPDSQPIPRPNPAPATSPDRPSAPDFPRQKAPTDRVTTFRDIKPILAANCMRCHVDGGELGSPPEGLVLTSIESVLRASERPVVIPGNAAASLMIRHIAGSERPRMPFDGPPWLTDEETSLLVRWINEGARDDDGRRSSIPAGRELRLEGTLTAQWAVDGVPFRVNGGARIRDVRIGGRVEVRAIVQSDGSLLATRVRGR